MIIYSPECGGEGGINVRVHFGELIKAGLTHTIIRVAATFGTILAQNNTMRATSFLSVALASLALARPQAQRIDYGPCDYNGNDNCRDVMDNTACFLNPRNAEQIFRCIPGGKEGVGPARWLPAQGA